MKNASNSPFWIESKEYPPHRYEVHAAGHGMIGSVHAEINGDTRPYTYMENAWCVPPDIEGKYKTAWDAAWIVFAEWRAEQNELSRRS